MVLQLEDFVRGVAEDAGEGQGQREARLVALALDRVDALARDATASASCCCVQPRAVRSSLTRFWTVVCHVKFASHDRFDLRVISRERVHAETRRSGEKMTSVPRTRSPIRSIRCWRSSLSLSLFCEGRGLCASTVANYLSTGAAIGIVYLVRVDRSPQPDLGLIRSRLQHAFGVCGIARRVDRRIRPPLGGSSRPLRSSSTSRWRSSCGTTASWTFSRPLSRQWSPS